MLNTKDFEKVQREEKDYFHGENNFNHRFNFCDCEDVPCVCGKTLKFRMTDGSLENIGINPGDVLVCSEDFEPFKDEGCLFIVSLSGGDMVARFVRIEDGGNFWLRAANERVADLIAFAEDTDVIGLVVPRIEPPHEEIENFYIDYDFTPLY